MRSCSDGGLNAEFMPLELGHFEAFLQNTVVMETVIDHWGRLPGVCPGDMSQLIGCSRLETAGTMVIAAVIAVIPPPG